MRQCECRYACDNHMPYYTRKKYEDKTLDEWRREGGCQKPAGDFFLRFVCTQCQEFTLMQVCDTCWNRIHRWLAHNAIVTCENCNKRINSQDCWKAYEDTK
jgi:hypothetical protein